MEKTRIKRKRALQKRSLSPFQSKAGNSFRKIGRLPKSVSLRGAAESGDVAIRNPCRQRRRDALHHKENGLPRHLSALARNDIEI